MIHVVVVGRLRVTRETVIVYVFISNPFPPKHVVCNLFALKCIPWSTHLSTSVPLSNCQFKHCNYKMRNNRDKDNHSQLGQYQTGYATERYDTTTPTRLYFKEKKLFIKILYKINWNYFIVLIYVIYK